MKYKRVKLEWYVLRVDCNSHKVVKYNILNDEIKDIIYKGIKRKEINTYAELKARLDRWMHYYYWCKCECEMLIGSLFFKSEDELEKVDMYRQIEPNLDRIAEYIVHAMDIKFDK